VRLRIGIVLGPGGGALKQILLPFRLGLGGQLGSGAQWMSWVHIDDVIGLIRHAIENETVQGAVNATAPQPVTNRQFTRTLARVLGRPAILPVPALALRLWLGEIADALLLSGQRVLSEQAKATGYTFRYPELEPALRQILGMNGSRAGR